MQIEKMMKCSYRPSLADSNRLYQDYKVNQENLANALSDAYSWLAQEPACVNYKGGKLYMRCEMTNCLELLVVHYIYINEKKHVILHDYFSDGNGYITDYSLKELAKSIKEIIYDEIDLRGVD